MLEFFQHFRNPLGIEQGFESVQQMMESVLNGKGTAGAAEQSRPWTEWSAKDVGKILTDSFWSHTQTETDLNRPNSFTRRLTDAQVLSQSARINYRIRFLSAGPVRQALYRLAKLNPKAAALDLKKLEAFIVLPRLQTYSLQPVSSAPGSEASGPIS